MAFGVYLHIPFCVQKCRYCDFYSLGHRDSVPEEYIEALLREIHRFHPQNPDTVYFGGGTPSLLTPQQAERLLQALAPAPHAEITLEANPGTVDKTKLQAFRAAGINRLSLGVQTAYDDSLARLGRIHTAAQSRQTLRDARAAGFENISGDIMLALPQYTTQELSDTLTLLVDEGVTHISSYLLKLEPNTPFGRTPPAGLPDEDAASDFYLQCVRECTARGFAQYEISNFARPGFESRHNLLYWNCEDYLGLGCAAHSCMDGRRFYWPNDLGRFIAGCDTIEEGLCTVTDFIMLQLRLCTGLNLRQLQLRWGFSFSEKQLSFLQKCVQNNLALFDGEILRLTPRGMLVQNSILCELI